MKCKTSRALLAGLMTLSILLPLSACGKTADNKDMDQKVAAAYGEGAPLDVMIEEEAVPLAGSPSVLAAMPQASGTAVQRNDKAVIDYSNTKDGYVMVQYSAATSKKIKAQVKGPSGVTYTYNLNPGSYETLPLSDGNGSYKVTMFENVSGSSYATVISASFSAQMKDEFAPFSVPNQYVNYNANSQVVAVASQVCTGASKPLDKVAKVYNYVVSNFTYDTNKAKTVQSGYLPNLDAVLAAKKGICFDYAAVMAAMLRSQDVPTKLVVGYSKDVYHAWITVYTPEAGWVEAIRFDGKQWKLMDPTFASSAKQSKEIMDYIGNGSNYSAKYLY